MQAFGIYSWISLNQMKNKIHTVDTCGWPFHIDVSIMEMTLSSIQSNKSLHTCELLYDSKEEEANQQSRQ